MPKHGKMPSAFGEVYSINGLKFWNGVEEDYQDLLEEDAKLRKTV